MAPVAEVVEATLAPAAVDAPASEPAAAAPELAATPAAPARNIPSNAISSIVRVTPTPGGPTYEVPRIYIPSEPPTPSRPTREPVAEEPHGDLAAEDWFKREKARRTKPLTNDLMAEARELLLQAVAEAGPRRGRPVRVGAAAKPKPKARAADDFDLDEYRPGEKK